MQLRIVPRPVNDQSTWLKQYCRDVTSQTGEDGVIEKIFELIGAPSKVCVELGAWDGKLYSNTCNLIQQGWTGFLIEGNAEKFKALQANHGDSENVTLINTWIGLHPEEPTLEKVLLGHGCPLDFDLLSIDVDGNDYYIWESLERYQPRLVVIEFNPTVPNDVFFVQDRSFDVNQGCSLSACIELGKAKGYELVFAAPFNAFFVRAEYFPRFGIQDNSIDAMYEARHSARIFHCFDGTIHVAGMPRLIWQDIALAHEDFQVIPRSLRQYGDRRRTD